MANEKGKDSSAGKTDLALNDDYLWLSYDFSVPLAWVTAVEPLGPGFLVAWRNELSDEDEGGIFCIRKMFGYNTAARDALVERIERARAAAEHRPKPMVVASAAVMQTCERCGSTSPTVYDFDWVFTVIQFLIKKPDRRTLCPGHARLRFLKLLVSNLTLGVPGIGILASPIASFAAAKQLRRSGALGIVSFPVAAVLAFLPYGLVVWAVTASLWEAFHI